MKEPRLNNYAKLINKAGILKNFTTGGIRTRFLAQFLGGSRTAVRMRIRSTGSLRQGEKGQQRGRRQRRSGVM